MHYQPDVLTAAAYAAFEAGTGLKVDNRSYAMGAQAFFWADAMNGPVVPVVVEPPLQPAAEVFAGAYVAAVRRG